MTITNSCIFQTAANLTFTFASMAKSAALYATARRCHLALSNNIVARSINWFGRLGHRANGGCFNPTREFLADGSTEHWVIHLSVFPQSTMQYKILHLRKNHTKKEHNPYKYHIFWIRNKTTFLKHKIMGDFTKLGIKCNRKFMNFWNISFCKQVITKTTSSKIFEKIYKHLWIITLKFNLI